MAFIAKKDYCGLGIDGKLVCASANMGASSSDVTAPDDEGSIVASTQVSGGATPNCSYDIKADVPFTGANQIKLGKVTTVDSKKYALASVSITLAAGAAPTVAATSTDVEDTATTDGTYDVPAFTLPLKHKAAFLFSEATLTGDGCKLVNVAYNMAATPTVDRDELGAPNSSSVSAGAITAAVTINQTGTATPTLTAATGWTCSVLTQDNPKGGYPTWTATLTKYLTKTSASE